jgi:hypothetical protein
MKNLLYKEFKLSIHKAFWFGPIVYGALLLIPQWIYLIALMYVFWVTVPNIYSTYNSQNDRTFCMLMPIKKEDYVKSKIMSLMILELAHLVFAAVFAIIHNQLYPQTNFVLDLNFAFFGVGFLMYGVFNLIFYPIYFKTAYFFGKATIFGNIGAVLFGLGIEFAVIFIPELRNLLEGTGTRETIWQLVIFFGGVVGFFIMNYIAFNISKGKFERTDL